MYRIAFAFLVACGADRAAPDPVAPATPPDECQRACGRQAACLPATYADHDPASCIADCRAHLARRDPVDPGAGPRVYADCLEQLPCADIVASMAMNMGPAGYCYSRALHGG